MAENPPVLACQDHLLASELRLVQAGPVTAAPQTRGRTRGARHRDPAVNRRGCRRLRLRRRWRRRLQRHPGLRGRRRAAAGQRPEKRNIPGNRAAAPAPPHCSRTRAGEAVSVPDLRGSHGRRNRDARGSRQLEYSPPPLARLLRRRLSPQTTACPAPAPDAI